MEFRGVYFRITTTIKLIKLLVFIWLTTRFDLGVTIFIELELIVIIIGFLDRIIIISLVIIGRN